jgi:CCR4-NOT transcriptional complex subunit CAF120
MQQQFEPEGNNSQGQTRRVPTTIAEQDDDSSSSSSHYNSSQPTTRHLGAPSPNSVKDSRSPPVRQSTPMAFVERSSSKTTSSNSATSIPADRLSPSSRPGLGRKPSGARAQTTRSYGGDGISSSHQLTEEEETQSEEHTDSTRNRMDQPQTRPSVSSEDPNLDALAALSYLDADDEKTPSPRQVKATEPLNVRSANKAPSPPPVPAQEPSSQFKSSFAPSKQAAERKAKAQAQQAAHHAAVHKPGRSNGKRKSRVAGTWNESSDEDEEEEEEEEEDDDVDSDGERLANKQANSSLGVASSNNSLQYRQNQAQLAEMNLDAPQAYSHLRPPRTLPQIPPNQNYSKPNPLNIRHVLTSLSAEEFNASSRRVPSDQYSEAGRRTYYDGTQIRTQADFPQPGAARQSMWSQVLDPGRTPGTLPEAASNARDTFVQLEPTETMTKAFTPQGLLSAGIQDKQDRSAKRQEELARETGASLINVPNKPPPPQMGLLGAITAHERDRKREGGVGAALTEREREKRLAEERQRRFDDHQRQQLDQMQQGGSMYGGQFPGYNNMMGNPMMMMNPMMGMNPMMTGGGMSPMMTGGGMAPMMTGQMGFPGMMPGYNPQHMFAAQQAAQAYQQAMMAFSVAGSQVGGDGGGTPPQLNPNMTGGGMGGFDPRMSMMGMPMMAGPQMGMGMQMTGMSGFDPRFPPNMNSPQSNSNDPGLAPPGPLGGPGQGQFPSGNSSPAGRGSPLARTGDTADNGRESLRPTSPKA